MSSMFYMYKASLIFQSKIESVPGIRNNSFKYYFLILFYFLVLNYH